MMNQDDKNLSKEEKFIQHLERSTNIVRSWPEWKRHLMGAATPEERQRRLEKMKEQQ